MEEFGRLTSSTDQIELDFVEQEATPEFLMKLNIQLHLSVLSLSNTQPITSSSPPLPIAGAE
jgi:hypothetical protein